MNGNVISDEIFYVDLMKKVPTFYVKLEDGVYGKSITDPCLGWEKTERLVLDIADLR